MKNQTQQMPYMIRTEKTASGSSIALLILIVTFALMLLSTVQIKAQVDSAWFRIIPFGNSDTTYKFSGTTPAGMGGIKRSMIDKKWYVYNKNLKKWTADTTGLFQGQKGDTGPVGPMPFGNVLLSNVPYGIPAKLEIIQLPENPERLMKLTLPEGKPGADGASIKGDKGDKGDTGLQGLPGTSGGLGGSKPYIDPDDYGAIHQDKTIAEAGKSVMSFPGIGATANDPVDWAAWQIATTAACTTGKQLIAYGEYYWRDKQVLVPKFFKSFTLNGSSCYINITGSNGTAAFSRPAPVDNGEANIQINSFVRIEGLQIGSRNGLINRRGIEIGPTYNSIYKGIDCFSLMEAIHLRFALNTQVEMCTATDCKSGWIADIGNWSGASNSNSQSNNTSFKHCRYYGNSQAMAAMRAAFPNYKEELNAEFFAKDVTLSRGGKTTYQKIKEFVNGPAGTANRVTSGGVAFGIYGCSGVIVEEYIIEGLSVAAGIDYDAMGSTVVKGFSALRGHFECVNSASVAIIKIRASAGLFDINNIFSQYPAITVDAEATIGYPFIEVSHCAWLVPINGKYFKNTGCSWALNYNDNMLASAADAPNKFTGDIPVYCASAQTTCGSKTVTVIGLGRF